MDRKRIITYWGDGKKIDEAQQQTGVVSSILCHNIARPIQGIIPFDEFAIQKQNDPDVSVQKDGKPVLLTNAQTKIIYALSQAVTMQRGEERMKEYIESINSGTKPKEQIILNVDIKALAKKIQPNNAKQDDIDKLSKDVIEMSNIMQSFKYGDYEIEQSLFIVRGMLYKHTKDGVEDKRHLEKISLEFAPIFFYQLGKAFAMIPDKLFDVWGKEKGTRSDLFVNLLSQLLSVFGNHHSAYEAATRRARIDNKNRKPEEADKIVAKAQRDALTYSEYSTTIQSRTITDYTSTRAQKGRFKKDVQNACDVFKKIGLLKDCKVVKTSKGERWDFVFNPDYNKAVEAEITEG